MKLLAILVTFTSAGIALAGDCSNQSPALRQAVEEFCNKKNSAGQPTNDITIPSLYAETGHAVGKAGVAISGNCDPPQWVPADICMAQFHDMCDKAHDYAVNFHGWAAGKAGQDQCQRWFFWNN